METDKKMQTQQIKAVTKDSHVRAENTELMLAYQRGNVSLTQYKLLLCSLYEIYQALEEALDNNSNHPTRLESVERDLEHFYGQDWREKIVVPAATKIYAHRLRQIGKDNPEYLVAHAYTRYLGDLSGGQVLGRITQKSLGLKGGEGLSFFSFPGVSSPNLFKQLYRSRMNSIDSYTHSSYTHSSYTHRSYTHSSYTHSSYTIVAKLIVAILIVAIPIVAIPIVAKLIGAIPIVAIPIVAKLIGAIPIGAKLIVAIPIVAKLIVAIPIVAKLIGAIHHSSYTHRS
uniref:heme oxygenase (biliverdin-producing) n=1 Tax=Oncorhynchus kisutch TaxID=8019 RepID=A0A8C7GY86_ONCKI